ncbi:MBL fold metallo-hydrolase [Candidatus Parcubacteria bacterium]|nr:MBL fold metallo-hydrolase [Candidatus Parcubacteria bacterium]
MNITWFGQSCFQIITAKGKDSSVKIVIDPFQNDIGLNVPKLESDILLFTNKNCDAGKIKTRDYFFIDEPGEYDIKDVFIQGISIEANEKEKGKNEAANIYIIEAEGIRVCHLGSIKEKELKNGQLEKIGNVDILMVPVGEDAQVSAKIVSQIEPRIVIPMFYHIPKLKVKLKKVDDFLKVMGGKSVESQNKLSIKRKDLPKEGREIMILKT